MTLPSPPIQEGPVEPGQHHASSLAFLKHRSTGIDVCMMTALYDSPLRRGNIGAPDASAGNARSMFPSLADSLINCSSVIYHSEMNFRVGTYQTCSVCIINVYQTLTFSWLRFNKMS